MYSYVFVDLFSLLPCRWPVQQRCELRRHAEGQALPASSRCQHGHIYSSNGIDHAMNLLAQTVFSWSVHTLYHVLYLWPKRPTHAPLTYLKVSTESHYTFPEEMCFIWFRLWLCFTTREAKKYWLTVKWLDRAWLWSNFNWNLYHGTETDNSVLQSWGHSEQERHLPCFHPDRPTPGRGGVPTTTPHNCWWVWYYYIMDKHDGSNTTTAMIDIWFKNYLPILFFFMLLSCSIIYA